MPDDDDGYQNVRDPEVFGPLIGERVVDVTQHDRDEWDENRVSYVCLHFGNGMVVKFPIGDAGIEVLNHPAGGDEEDPC
jgi:hypothetical protein